jgi:hypothetical protein
LAEHNGLKTDGTTYERFLGSFGGYGGIDLSFATLEVKKR